MTNRINGALFVILFAVGLTGCAQKANPMKETETVTQSSASIPIACRMDALTKDERARSQSLRAELAGLAKETRELPTGYSFRYPADAAVFEKLAEWILLERRCCPFLSFAIAWESGDDAAPWLALTGPQGTKGFLASELPGAPKSQ